MQSMKEMLAQKLKNQKLDNSSNQNDELQTTPQPPPPKKVTDVFAAQAEESSIDRSVKFIPLDLIDVEEQIRKNFDPQRIEDLALDFSSSPTKQPAQPITVWKKPDGR
jgi:hypothetical protein